MLSRDQLLAIFRKYHALQRGHFELSSGSHSGHYFQFALVQQHPRATGRICGELARRFKRARPTVVIGPAIGGIIVAYETARALNVRAMYAERVDAEMQLRRGFGLTKDDRVIVMEDVITTGESARKVAELVEAHGAKLIGFGSVVDRSGGKVKFDGKRYERLLTLTFENFRPEECPLCSEHVPVTRPGRPKKMSAG